MDTYYLDESYAIMDKTLLSYSGKMPVLSLPGRLGDIDVDSVGEEAFYGSKTLQAIAIPLQYALIGSCAFAKSAALTNVVLSAKTTLNRPKQHTERIFYNCEKLSSVTLVGLKLSNEQYERLKRSNIRYGNDGILLRRNPELAAVTNLMENVECPLAVCIPTHVYALLHTPFDPNREPVTEPRCTTALEAFIYGGGSPFTTEETIFQRCFVSDRMLPLPKGIEEGHTTSVRIGKAATYTKSSILTIDDTKTLHGADGCRVSITLRMGYFYWLSFLPILFEGSRYYLYRRHYLTGKAETIYDQMDVAILDEDGEWVQGEVASLVYAKYRLLSVL